MSRARPVRRRRSPEDPAGVLLLIGVLALFAGCRDDADVAEIEEIEVGAVELEPQPWTRPETVDLTAARPESSRPIETGEPRRFPPCRRWFEREGGVAESFPGPPGERALRLTGCRPAAREADGEWEFVAYALPDDGDEGTDLRLVVYRGGDLEWSRRIDRTDRTVQFDANLRDSFVAPLPPRLVCAGTLWSGETQIHCFDLQSGRPQWQGALPFWSGIAPRAAAGGLVAADVSGMTRRYPFTGAEMRRRDFEELGGRSAFYAASDDRLFFAPRPGGPTRLTAYELASFDADWQLALPELPAADDAHVFEDSARMLVRFDETVWAIDTESGRPAWGAEVGASRPAAAHLDGRLYLLVQRDEADNRLYALDPADGTVHWSTSLPSGYLELEALDGRLFIRSVKAVRRLRVPADGEERRR